PTYAATAVATDTGPTGGASLSGNAEIFLANIQELIVEGGPGTFSQTGGTNSAFRIDIGGGPGSGTYTLSAETLNPFVELVVANAGAGTLTQTGGTITTSELDMSLNGGTGVYNLQGGTLSVSGP